MASPQEEYFPIHIKLKSYILEYYEPLEEKLLNQKAVISFSYAIN